ncbi:unnamed protein product [Schistocephalus solidus]|uniref:Secreted protein n=1 Tax=Schistocephalus solidus TaxID=70667 RepID=A0A183T075_SCHSO|nr:unnamed protein product [Schistocephalus solidus]
MEKLRRLRSFLSVMHLYRLFLSNCVGTNSPLVEYFSRPKGSLWFSAEFFAAFDKVKAVLTDAMIPNHHTSRAPLFLMGDAFKSALWHRDGFTKLLTCVGRCTYWAEAVPLPNV